MNKHSLTSRACKLFNSRRLAAKWVLAIRWMRKQDGGSLWLLDGGIGVSKWRGG